MLSLQSIKTHKGKSKEMGLTVDQHRELWKMISEQALPNMFLVIISKLQT